MKRFEALEEIRKILAMNGKDNGCGELEEAILHHLESLGMLSPEYYTDYPTEAGYKYNKGFVVKGWEPEDE